MILGDALQGHTKLSKVFWIYGIIVIFLLYPLYISAVPSFAVTWLANRGTSAEALSESAIEFIQYNNAVLFAYTIYWVLMLWQCRKNTSHSIWTFAAILISIPCIILSASGVFLYGKHAAASDCDLIFRYKAIDKKLPIKNAVDRDSLAFQECVTQRLARAKSKPLKANAPAQGNSNEQ